ncbi:MAG: phage major capsid protein [Ilumatobacteraceae bacterium]
MSPATRAGRHHRSDRLEKRSHMPITTESFDGAFWPDEVTATIALACITGAPFARSLTALPTSKPNTAFPTASPTGFDFVGEGQPLPQVDLNDSKYVVATCKLAGTFSLSNESLDDADSDLGGALGLAVKDAMSPKLDEGLLFGSGGDEPEGVMDVAPEFMGGADYRADVVLGWAEMVDAGADPEAIIAFASASVIGWELARTDNEGRPIHQGTTPMLGPVRMVAVPTLSAGQTLLVDTSRVFLVVRNDFQVDFSGHEKFSSDSTVARIRGRFSIAAPHSAKSLRKITAAS